MSLDQYDQLFEAAGKEWNVDPRLLKAVAGQESAGDPRAVSPAGARGLMQIMPDTGRGLGMTDLHDPVQSIYAGAKYLNEALNTERTPEDALRYYHGGPDWRAKYGKESRDYAPAVTARYVALANAAPPRGAAARTGGTDYAGPGVPPPATPAAQPQTDEQWLDEQAKTYPGLAAKDAEPAPTKTAAAAPTQGGAKPADPFSAALDAAKAATPAAPAESGKSRQKPAEQPAAPADAKPADPFTAALEAAKQPDMSVTVTAKRPGEPAFGPEPAANEKAGNAMIPGPSTSSPTVPQQTYQPGVGAQIGNFLGDAATRLGQAVVGGYQNTPGVLTPAAQAAVESVPIIGEPLGLVTQGATAALKAGGALFAGTQSGVATAGDAVSPGLGRDLAAGMEVLPAATGMHPLAVRPTIDAARARMAENALNNQAPLSPEFKANPLAPGAAERMAVPRGADGAPLTAEGQAAAANAGGPPTGPPSSVNPNVPPPGAPGIPAGPQSVGAAASRDMTHPSAIDLSPETVKANRRQAEMAEINAPPTPGDDAIHVEGSHPTLAQRSGNPAISQREGLLRERNPNAFYGERGVLTAQNDARVKKYESLAPSDTAIDGFRQDRSRLAETDKAAIMEHAKAADLQPVAEHLDGLLNDPRIAENPDVVAVLRPFRDALNAADGTLKTDPMAVWGMHDRVRNAIEKSKDRTSTERFAQSQLIDLKGVIDGAMNKATDGHFQTFLDHYAELSQKINAGELLNKFRQLRLTNAKGEINANALHKFVSDLAYSRGKKGVDPAMDIPDEVMAGLISIDTDLKRAGHIDLGKARGSPTNLLGVLAKDMGIGMAHAGTAIATGAFATGNPVPNMMLQGALNAGKNLMNTGRVNYLTRKHLAPPPGGYTNPLAGP